MKQRGWLVLWIADGIEHDALFRDRTAADNYAVRVHGTVHPVFSEV